MFKTIQNVFSFRLSDVLGILIGAFAVLYCTDMELFHFVTSPRLYFLIFLVMLLFHSYLWLFVSHGESAYTKQMLSHIFRDFFRISLSCVSMIGVYFLIHTFF